MTGADRIANSVTVLHSAGPVLAKIWNADGTMTASASAWQLRPEVREVGDIDGLHALLQELNGNPRAAIVRGQYIGDAAAREVLPDLVARHNAGRIRQGKAAVSLRPGFVPRVGALLEDVPRRWLMLDVDRYQPTLHEPQSDPEGAAREFVADALPAAFQRRSFVWQCSASAGHPGARDKLKMHLWFMVDGPGFTSNTMSLWAQNVPAVDACVFAPTQLHYTAAPVLADGMADPLAGRRVGLCRGADGDTVPLAIEATALAASSAPRRRRDQMADPRDKQGIVGAYCRAVDCSTLADRHPDLFSPGRSDRHFTWLAGSGTADGVRLTDDDQHLMSSHDSAPTGQNRAANAYDWDRCHMFGHLDGGLAGDAPIRDRPSVGAMNQWVRETMPEVWAEVRAEINERRGSADEDFAGFAESEDGGKAPGGPLDATEHQQATQTPAESPKPPKAGVRPPLKIWSPSDLRNRPPARWLVPGWIPERGMGVLYGDSNIGKSFAALDLAMSVALGGAWHGIPARKGGAVYVAAEGGHGFGRRFDAHAAHREISLDSVPIGLVDEGLDLRTNVADADRIIEACQEFATATGGPVRLVVLDTLARMIAGGNENAPEDMGKVIRAAGRVADALGAFVLLVHHTGKDDTRGARGHSSLRAAVDTEIEARMDGTARVLELTKQRDGPKDMRLAFRLQDVVVGVDPGTDQPIQSCLAVPVLEVPPRRAERNARSATPTSEWQRYVMAAWNQERELLDLEGRPSREGVKVAAEAIATSARQARGVEMPASWKTMLRNALNALIDAGTLVAVGDTLGRGD